MTVHAYMAVKRVSAVEGTSPHQLISILYEASLSQIAMASQHLQQGRQQQLHECVNKAIAIVQELQASLLNYDKNELAGNLFDLYSYIVRTLIESKAKSDQTGFSTCTQLLEILQDTWSSIEPENVVS